MIVTRRAIGWTVIGWLAVCAVAQAQVDRGTIAGQVVDAAGTPRAGVAVAIVQVLTEVRTDVRTDAAGAFRAQDLRPGPYRVSVSDGDLGAVEEFTLGPAEQRTVNLRLQRGVTPPPSPEPALPEPPRPTEAPTKVPDFVPMPDRWHLEFPIWQRYPRDVSGEYPYVRGRKADPYNQNIIKGDRPVIGQDVFFIFTGVSETVFEYRRLPTPSGVSAERAGSTTFFGDGRQYAVAPTGVLSFELFKGDTAFKPRAWAVRVTPAYNLNYVNVRERNVLSATPESGATRRRQDVALQEAFGELKLFDVGPNYDFVSIRAGIQPFNSDFRGFLFRDTNLGLRLFGTWGRNRNQWNIAAFDQLEKETNSELNLTTRRTQYVVVANYYRQDFLAPGYTISTSFHANVDDGTDTVYDANGFLVRPAPIGLIQPHRIRAYYAGVGGDGHVARLNVTHQFYQAFGHDEFNGISGKETDIRAQFAAVELSMDHDWFRPKASFVFASGDDDPDDGTARGFDAIVDNPNIAGGPFSFWNREGIRLSQTSVGLVGRNSLLPSLRSRKSEGQANFVNPGLLLVSGGFTADLTRKLRLDANVNYLRFHRTDALRRVLFQSVIEQTIGIDVGVGFQYRPLLNDNIIITAGMSAFKPGTAFRQILTDTLLYAPFAALTLTY